MKTVQVGTLCVLALMFVSCSRKEQVTQTQQPQTGKAAADPTAPTQEPAQAATPTLGFAKIKDVSPILDSDSLVEEGKLEKRLPGNQFIKDKRALHETALMHDFLDGFRESKECEGITFYMSAKKAPGFTVQISVNFHDNPNMEQEWIWMLFDAKTKGMGGLGTQSSAKLAARDVCMTVWEDIDPNHYKKPGGRIE